MKLISDCIVPILKYVVVGVKNEKNFRKRNNTLTFYATVWQKINETKIYSLGTMVRNKLRNFVEIT